MNDIVDPVERKGVNKILVEFIEEYIKIGEKYPLVLTQIDTLIPGFKEKIKIVRDSDFEDFTTKIEVKIRRLEQK